MLACRAVTALRGAGRRARSTLRVLGIESSCDDTAAAIVSSDGQIISETCRHQHQVHEAYGGIVPGLAADHHLRNMPMVVRETLDKAGMQMADVDAVAVTRGPGLPASLSVGVAAGKTLAAVHGKPLVGVHHMEAHALMARMGAEDAVRFPYLCLLISGGHTQSLVVHDVNEHTLLGVTRDDSVGEAFDKVARELGIAWIHAQDGGGPGPALEALARTGDPARFALPLPMEKSDSARSLDFSFSGLKTRILRMREQGIFSVACRQDQADLAAAFQHAAAEHLRRKTRLALAHAKAEMGVDVTCLVASGGVASNHAVRAALASLADLNGLQLVCPPPRLCTDNGVMIAWTGVERLRRGLIDPYDIDFIQRWPLDQLRHMQYKPHVSSPLSSTPASHR